MAVAESWSDDVVREERMLSTRDDTAILILRVVSGVVWALHGWQKLFVMGISGVQEGFAQMGVPYANVVGPLIATLELAGGIAIVLGVLTRLVSLGLLADMIGAMVLVHMRNGFFLPTGFEYVLVLAGIAATLVVGGAGAYSVDALFRRRNAVTTTTKAPAAM